MEAIILMGLQGAGKSSFYQDRFFSTHVRISLDLMKTRYRQQSFLEVCLATDLRFCLDNTNLTREERSKTIDSAKMARFTVIGYYFQSKIKNCLSRNAQRTEDGRVPDKAILSASKKLELPSLGEGFDQLYYVRLHDTKFIVEEWQDEV